MLATIFALQNFITGALNNMIRLLNQNTFFEGLADLLSKLTFSLPSRACLIRNMTTSYQYLFLSNRLFLLIIKTQRMKLLLIFLVAASFFCASCYTTGKVTKRQAAGLDTITNINQLDTKKKAIYKNKKNEYYIMRYAEDPRDSTEEEEGDSVQLTDRSGGQQQATFKVVWENKRCDGDNFDGSNRKRAKLSISNSTTESFNTLTSLINTLQDADDMAAAISGSNAPRITAEDRNVNIRKTWLYAYSRQTDEDFHVIVGNTKKPYASTKYFNIEISGLPHADSASFTALRDARNSFFSKASEDLCKSGYFFFES